MINIVIFNGGRGASTLIPELLNREDIKLSSIVNAYDDGKSTGEIRNFFEMLGPSDIRKAQQLMISKDSIDCDSLHYVYDLRFPKSLSNQAIFKILEQEASKTSSLFFGAKFNDSSCLKQLRLYLKIFIKNYKLISKSIPAKKLTFKDCSLMNCLYAGAFLHFDRNIEHASLSFEKIFNLGGAVIPTSIENKKLVGLRTNGEVLFSEAEIVELRSNVSIERVYLFESYPPKGSFKGITFAEKKYFFEKHHSYVEASPRAQRAIEDADIIIYSPGTQHSSLYPTYLSDGIPASIANNKRALKVFITNIGADYETPFYKAHDYIEGAFKYLNLGNSTKCELKDYFSTMLVNKTPQLKSDNYVKIYKSALDKLRIKKVIKNFEESNTGKHDGKKVIEAIFQEYSLHLKNL